MDLRFAVSRSRISGASNPLPYVSVARCLIKQRLVLGEYELNVLLKYYAV
jgi:hypothetical protein